MSRRDCLTSAFVSGKCSKCGNYVPFGMHLPTDLVRLFCSRCCPVCNTNELGKRRKHR